MLRKRVVWKSVFKVKDFKQSTTIQFWFPFDEKNTILLSVASISPNFSSFLKNRSEESKDFCKFILERFNEIESFVLY